MNLLNTTYQPKLKAKLSLTALFCLVLTAVLFVLLGGQLAYAASAPLVTGVVPSSAYNTGGDTLTVTGTGFDAGAQVLVGGVVAGSVVVQNDTVITAVTPATFSIGDVKVRVTNSDGQFTESTFTYKQTAPTISSVTPTVGPATGGRNVAISTNAFQTLRFKRVSSGGDHSLGLTYDGKVYAWGYNTSGQLGTGSTTNSITPMPVDTSGVLAGKNIIAIAAGGSHSLALDSAGKVYAWGAGGGRLGNGITANSSVPVAVVDTGALAGKVVTDIAASELSSYALSSDGFVYSWGGNGSGQLGNNSATQSNSPVAVLTTGVLAGKTIRSIAAGSTFALALDTTGKVYSWGNNANGQLGNGSLTQSSVPVAVLTSGVLLNKTVVAITAGNGHSVVLDTDGKLYSWGINANGQLGNNSTTQSSSPVAVVSSGVLNGKTIASVSIAGGSSTNHSSAIDSNGKLYTWGFNNSGQLGNGSTAQSTVPVATTDTGVLSGKVLRSSVAVSNRTLALDQDGLLYGWGNNVLGQLGNNTTTNSISPIAATMQSPIPFTAHFGGTQAQSTLSSLDSISTITPAHSTGVVDVSLEAYGVDTATSANAYTYVPAPEVYGATPLVGNNSGGDIITISGANFRPGATVMLGYSGPLATTYVNDTTLQVQLTASTQIGPVDITVTNDPLSAQSSQSATHARGFKYIQNAPMISSIAPVSGPIAGGNTATINGAALYHDLNFAQVSAGDAHACGLSDSRVYCWGSNGYGQLGDNTLTSRRVPTPVATYGTAMHAKDIVMIATGANYTVALDVDGNVYGWGQNNYGQLGNNSTGNSSIPVSVVTSGVLSGKHVSAIGAGGAHTLAATREGGVYSWGYNNSGQLGNNTSTDSRIPVTVTTGGVVFTALGAGSNYSVGLSNNGDIYTWGDNSFGQLGSGNLTQRYVPTIISVSGQKFTAIAAHGSYAGAYGVEAHTLALSTNGIVYAWGRNGNGQLGNGSTTDATAPVLVTTSGVLSGKTVRSIAVGRDYSTAVTTDGKAYGWGLNNYGQLGNNSTNQQTSPVATFATGVLSGKTLASITSSQNSSIAVGSDGKMYGWGFNGTGILGNNLTTNSSSPVASSYHVPYLLNVSFGINNALVTNVTESSITTTAPSGSAGKVNVAVDTAGLTETVNVSDAYEYIAPPSVFTATPSSGYVTGGDTVVLSGTNFSQGSTVTVDGVVATVTDQTSSSITITVPPHTNGAVDIAVTDTAGQKTTVASAYTYNELPLLLNSINPAQGPASGGQTATVSGDGFVPTSRFSQVSTGGQTTCGLAQGRAYCWGAGAFGVLGNGATANSLTPVPVDMTGVLSGKTISKIDVKGVFVTALTSDGDIVTWGNGSSGQLGNGSMANSAVPVLVDKSGVLAGRTIVDIAAGDAHVLALTNDGLVYAWGTGYALGYNSSTSSAVPVAVNTAGVLSGKTISRIAAGGAQSLALDSSGQVYRWGNLTNAQTAGSTTTQTTLLPVSMSASGLLSGKTATLIAAGSSHAMVRTSDNGLYTWGGNYNGTLGNGTTTTSTTAVAVTMSGALSGKVITGIAGGDRHSMVLASDGTVYTWGYNNYGQLGNNSLTQQTTPVAVYTAGALAGKSISQISTGSGASHGLAIDSSGVLYAWGYSANGQLGDGQSSVNRQAPVVSTSSVVVPASVYLGGQSATVTNVSQSSITFQTPSHGAGQIDVTVKTYDGQSATLSSAYQYVAPPVISGLTPSVGFISGGDSITLTGQNFSSGSSVKIGGVTATITNQTSTAITMVTPAHAAGAVAVVITDSFGQSATLAGSFVYQEFPPVITSVSPNRGPVSGGQTIQLNGTGFIAQQVEFKEIVTSSFRHTLGLTTDGRVYAWGDNSSGQLGNNTTTTSAIPVAVVTSGTPMQGKTITSIAVGSSHSLALASDGSVYAWGDNSSGQLGNGTTVRSLVPVAVSIQNIKSIAAHTTTSFFINNDGGVYRSGNAINGGTCGVLQADNKSTPAIINTGSLAGKQAVKISAGSGFAIILASDNTLHAVGNGCSGQLGNGVLATTSDPVAVTAGSLAGKTIADISSGMTHSLALASDGTVFSWGDNTNGQLGNNSTSARTTPTTIYTTGVLSGKTISAISAGSSHSLVVDTDGKVYSWGNNTNGRLGNNSTSQSLVPVAVTSSGVLLNHTITKVSAGQYHSIALATDGTVYGWGGGGGGQLGVSSSFLSDALVPMATNMPNDAAPRLTIGGNRVIARYVSSTQLTAITPTDTAGLKDVSVTNYDNQTATLASAYEYIAGPTITSLTPASGSIAGGEYTYLTGTNLTENTVVRFGSSVATTMFVNNTTLLVTTPPSLTPGAVAVSVTDEFGQTNALTSGYVYQLSAPTLSTVTPAYAKMSGGSTVTITGSGFVSRSGGGTWYSVYIDGQSASNVTYVNSTTLRADVPAHAPGSADVIVGGEYSEDATLINGLAYLPASYRFTNTQNTLMAGEPGSFTVEALDASGNPITSTSDISLRLSTTSANGFFARALSGPDMGWDRDTVIIPAGQSSATFFYRDMTSGTPTITSADALSTVTTQQATITSQYRILVTGVSNPTNAGVPSSITVQAVDYTNTPQADYHGTVAFSSADGGAILPAQYTFTSADHGRKTFINGVTMGTVGTWDVTVTDTSDAAIHGSQANIVVGAPASGAISQLRFITEPQSFALDKTSGIITVQTQDVTGLPIPVDTTTQIYLRSNSSTGLYSSDGGATWNSSPFALSIPSGSSFVNVLYKDTTAGSHALSAAQQPVNDFGWSIASQTVTVGVGAPARLQFSAPASVPIGQWTPVDIQLADASGNTVTSPNDLKIAISASELGLISLSADGNSPKIAQIVYINTGHQSVTVWVRATSGASLELDAVDARGVTQEETYNSGTVSIPLGEAQASGVAFTTIPTQARVYDPTSIQVSLKDQFGNIVSATEDTPVTIGSTSGDATFASEPTGTWASTYTATITTGSSTAGVFFKHSTVNPNVTVTAQSGVLMGDSATINVTANAYAGKIRFQPASPNEITAGDTHNFTVELLDAYGNPTVASETVEVGFGGTRTASSSWNGTRTATPNAPNTGVTITVPAGQGAATASYSDTLAGDASLAAYDQARWQRSCEQYEYVNGPCVVWSAWSNTSMGMYDLQIKAAAPTSYQFTTDPQTITKNTASQAMTIVLKDVYNNDTSYTSETAAALSTTSINGGFSSSSAGPFTDQSLTFAAGSSSATVYYQSTEISPQSGDTITVSGNALSQASQSIRVIEGFAEQVIIDANGTTTAVAGEVVPITLRTQTTGAVEVVVLNDTSFSLSSSTGEFSLTQTPFTPISSVTIAAESSSRPLFYRSLRSGPTTLAATSSSIAPVSTELAILSNTFYKLDFTSLPANNRVEAAKASGAFVATAYDEYGNVSVPSADNATDVNLTSTKAAGEFSGTATGPWTTTQSTIIAGGTTTTPFYYRIGQLNSDSSALIDGNALGAQTIRASAPDALAAEAEITAVGSLATRVVFTSAPLSLRAGDTSTLVTVQLRNTDETAAISTTAQDVTIHSLNLNDDNSFTAQHGTDVFSLTPSGDPITTITVPAGSSTAQFYVRARTAVSHRLHINAAIRDYTGGYLRTVSAVQNITVTAGDATNLSFASSQQTVHPDVLSNAIKIVLNDAFGNVASNEVTRQIALSSSCATGQFFSSPTGSPITQFTLNSGDNEAYLYYRDSVAGASACTLTISSANLADGTQSISVREPVYSFAITSAPQTIEAGQTSAPIIVTTRDRFGNTVAAEEPILVKLTSSGSDVTISPVEQTIVTGSSTASFTFVRTAAVAQDASFTLTANDTASHVTSSQQIITVTPGVPTTATFDTQSFSDTVGNYHPLRVELLNAYGKRTHAINNTTVTLGSSQGSGTFYRQTGATTYEQITTTSLSSGALQSDAIFYAQAQTTRTVNGGNFPSILTAQVSGLESQSAAATISAKTLSFSTGNFSAQASAFTPLRVTLSSPLPTDLTVTLSSSTAQGAFLASQVESDTINSVVISAGQTQSAEIFYRQTSITSGQYPELLTATPQATPLSTWAGSVYASFYNNTLDHLVFITAPSELAQNQTATYTVEARDDLGNVVPFTTNPYGYCLYVYSGSAESTFTTNENPLRGCVSVGNKKAIWVGSYATRASFSYRDTALGTHEIIAATTSGYGGIRQSTDVIINAATAKKLAFDKVSYGLIRGDELTVEAKLMSEYNYEVNDKGQVTATLTSDSTTGRFYNQTAGAWQSSLDVTFEAGQTSIQGIRYTDTTPNSSTMLHIASAGLDTGEATINLGIGPISALVFESPSSPLEKNQTGTYTVRILDAFGNTTPALQDSCLYVRASGNNGVISGLTTQSSCADVALPGGEVAYGTRVPAGATEFSFNATYQATGTKTLIVSTLPTGSGIATSTDILVIEGQAVSLKFSPESSELERGGVFAGNVTLQNAFGGEVSATENIPMTISSNLAEGTFAATTSGPWGSDLSTTIGAGQSSVSFFYKTGTSYLGEAILSAATAEPGRLMDAASTLTIVMGQVAQVVFVTPELTTTATHPSSAMTLQVQNQYGVETTTGEDLALYVRSDSNSGSFASSPVGPWNVNTVTIAHGQTSTDVYYRDETVGTHVITARNTLSPQEGETYLLATQDHSIVKQVFSHFIVTNISSPQRAGTASSMVVFAVDSENYVVAWYDGTVTFGSSDTNAVLPQNSYTFSPTTDRGIHTFTNSIAFKTTGMKSVSVTDQNAKQGTQYGIEVIAGNTAPARSIAFISANAPLTVDQNSTSERLTLELRDINGSPTNAPTGGTPIRITSNSPTGQFSTDGISWTENVITTVEASLSFSTTPLYYRDSAGGTPIITATDWIAGSDNALIANAQLPVVVRELSTDGTNTIYSKDYTGQFIQNPSLFAYNDSGSIEGYAKLDLHARDSTAGTDLASNWTILINGVTTTRSATANVAYQSPSLTPVVGAESYTVTVQTTHQALTGAWQSVIPVSPWRAAIGSISHDNSILTGSLKTTRSGIPTESPQVVIKVTGGLNQVSRTWNIAELLAGGLAKVDDNGAYSFRVPLRTFAGGEYTVIAQLSDGAGITAQDAADFTVNTSDEPTPTLPMLPGTGGGTLSPETPGDTSSRPEPSTPVPPREEASQPQNQAVSGLLKEILSAPSTPVRVAQSLLGMLALIAIILLYQIYKEWRHARILAAIINRDNKTIANKNTFLELASHHLRTPLTLLRASSELLAATVQQDAKLLSQELSTVILGLQAKIETIISNTNTSNDIHSIEAAGEGTKKAPRAITMPLFWLPVIVSVALTAFANWAVSVYGGQDISLTTIANQIILVLFGVVLLYTSLRILIMNTQKNEYLKRSQQRAEALNRAKVSFAQQVGKELADDVLHLSAWAQQIAPFAHPVAQKSLNEGTHRLEELVSRFVIMNSIYAVPNRQESFSLSQVVDTALVDVTREAPAARLTLAGNAQVTIIQKDKRLLSKLFETIFASMTSAGSAAAVSINARIEGDATTVTIEGPATEDTPAEDMFSVYSRSDQEEAGTYNDSSMHRLDLYLDRLIADELDADINASQRNGKTFITLKLHNNGAKA